jgi:hypothetical protein
VGEPDDKEEASISSEWRWKSIIDDGKEYEAAIDFTRGKVSAISFSVPGAEPLDIAEALFSALGRSMK